MPRPHVIALDSGIGGLGIVSSLRRAIPGVAITYLADHGFYPYGGRDGAELAERVVGLVAHLGAARPPDCVVIACNTASTIALETLRARLPFRFAGCVPPVKWAASLSRTRTIGLLATEATVGRDYVRALQARFAPDCRLLAHGARHLADAAEAKFRGESLPPGRVAAELGALFAQPGGEAIDTICLGCTHYGLLLDELRAAAPAGIDWLDPADAVARHVAGLLAASPRPAAPDRPAPDDVQDLALSTALPADPSERARLRRGFARHGFADLVAFSPPASRAQPAPPAIAAQWPRRTA